MVKGVVCGFDGQGVMVDIGAKTFAVVPTYEAVDKGENVEDKFKKGQEGEFLIIREEDEDGKFLLSKKKVDYAYAWKELEKQKLPMKLSWVRSLMSLKVVCLLMFQVLEDLFHHLNYEQENQKSKLVLS